MVTFTLNHIIKLVFENPKLIFLDLNIIVLDTCEYEILPIK